MTLASFRVGGGILLLLMAISMFYAESSRSRQTTEEAMEAGERGGGGVGVVPLAIPLLSGPGAISTVIIYTAQGEGPGHLAFMIGASALLGGRLDPVVAGHPDRVPPGADRHQHRAAADEPLLAAIAVEFIGGGLGRSSRG